jgi:hypothetical protein
MIRPALTPEQWAAKRYNAAPGFGTDVEIQPMPEGVGVRLSVGNGCYDYSVHVADGRHAIAALALHDQPFGFTREDEAVLRFYARHIAENPNFSIHACEQIHKVADKIAALLPPEGA